MIRGLLTWARELVAFMNENPGTYPVTPPGFAVARGVYDFRCEPGTFREPNAGERLPVYHGTQGPELFATPGPGRVAFGCVRCLIPGGVRVVLDD
jgi:hypothetical protein